MIRHFARCAAVLIGRLCLSLSILLLGVPASADWVNLGGAEVAPNIAEIHVDDDGVRIVLEVFVEDIDIFSDLVPSEWWASTNASPAPEEERFARFATEGISLRTGEGTILPVEAITVERRLRVDRSSPMAGKIDPYSGRPMPKAPEDPRVLYTELFYPFGETRPETLTISPPHDEDGTATVNIGVIAFHGSVPVIDFRYLSATATLHLDWADPWYTRFDNPNLTRHHKYPRMTFLYADPHEIRHEALVRVRDAMALVGHDVDGDTLDTDQAQALSEAAALEIGQRTPMTIEGTTVKADFDRAAFMRIGMRGLEFLQPDETVDIDADILGLIWSAPTDGLPQQATLEWTWFDGRAPDVAGHAVDAAGPFLFPLSPDDPVVTWTNHFKTNPYPDLAEVEVVRNESSSRMLFALGGMAALGLGFAAVSLARAGHNRRRNALIGGAVALVAMVAIPVLQQRQGTRVPELDPEKLTTLTSDILNNVYRAFDFRTEDQVYDRLALTLDGTVLEQVYLDQRSSLRIERAGGTEARVEALEVSNVEPLDGAAPGTLRLRANWVVRGTVGHWGHVHSRTNAYEADLVLAPVDGAWKVRGFDVISQERLM